MIYGVGNMKLIKEDIYDMTNNYLFLFCLLEYLNKTDILKKMPEYVADRLEPYVDTQEKRNYYAKTPEMLEIKRDMNGFAQRWADSVRELPYVDKVNVNPSPFFGLSVYVYVYYKPTRQRLENFYNSNRNRYDNIKFRFTEHGEYDYAKEKTPDDRTVEFKGKTFIQASNEMMDKIKNYYYNLREDETTYINRIKRKERRKKKKLLDLQNKQNNEQPSKEKTESFRLHIKE